MLLKFIFPIIPSIIFYLIMNKSKRIKEIKRYRAVSLMDGTYDEEYEIVYDKHLKSRCIWATITFAFTLLLSQFVEAIIAIAGGITFALLSGMVIEMICPTPRRYIKKRER